MNKKRMGLCILSVLLAVFLAAELIWLGLGLKRSPLPEPVQNENAEIIPEMVNASEKKEEPDEDGEENDQETEEEEEEPEEEPPVQMISERIMEAETVEDVAEDKSSDEKEKPGSGENAGEGEAGNKEGEDNPKDDPEDKPDPKEDDKKEEKELQIITNLDEFRTVYLGTLQDDTLNFYAYLENAKEGTELRVEYWPVGATRGKTLQATAGKNYSAVLKECLKDSQVNKFYLRVFEKGVETHKETKLVSYIGKPADKDNPMTGAGVSIEILGAHNGDTITSANQNPTLIVRAKSNESGQYLYSDDLKIWLDGKLIKDQPTGGPWYEYQLYLDKGYSGDYALHTVQILGTDPKNTRNTGYASITYEFKTIEEGEVIGTAYIQLDASTIGWGPIDDPWPVEIRQGQPASYAVLDALKDNGIDVEYSGTPDTGFYIRGLNLGDCSGLQPDETLWSLIDKDGLNKTGVYPGAVLREHDFTQGSGWMFSVGGSVYSGKGLSGYFLSPGETLYLRYTVAYGKDIGASSTQGNLANYCTWWINGSVIENHVPGTAEVKKEATCTEEGKEVTACTACGKEFGNQVIPALGHSFIEISRTEATTEAPGQIIYRCDRCSETKTEEIPILPPEVVPTPEPDPEPVPEPTPDSEEESEGLALE